MIKGKQYVIEVDYGVHIIDEGVVLSHRDGAVMVDGIIVKTWNEELPKQVSIEVAERPVVLKKVGLFAKGLDLLIENVKIMPDKM